ncbi:MAG: hypothetical protein GY871_11175 [Actinomycetales bacterium]|nr:hypothetical protein [Actinomycetales bacterium]
MINSRLKTYALTATGTTTLVAGGVTNAEIITSSGGPVNIQGSSATEMITLFTLAGQGVKAFAFMTGSWTGSGAASVGINVDAPGLSIERVASGITISAGNSFAYPYVSNIMYFGDGTMTYQTSLGMPIETSVLLGFSISDTADTFYGWINYSLSMSQGEYTFTVNSWAYNDVAGEGIIAGRDTAAGSAVPGLGGLAALAIGAAGVRSRRQRTVV